ncbi:MAG: dipeptide epimerase [Rhodobacteraceae bacterium]|nr:dipeptide epimerase [Paracoccaceae bacterium]
MTRQISIETERFKIAGEGFAISRGRRTHAEVLMVSISDGGVTGRGECVPYARYNESLDSVTAQIRAVESALAGGMSREELQNVVAAGAARNAIDCALWDLEAKQSGKTVAELAGFAPLKEVTTAYTLSVDTPEKMAKAAAEAASRPLLKVKLAGQGDAERIAAVRSNAPHSRLMVDANEAWDESCFEENMAACQAADVALIEQPLPAGKDELLGEIDRPVVCCADESLHTRKDLPVLRKRYDAINMKLDKAGGLTELIALADEAKKLDFQLFVGCMLGTSLAMAPAMLIAQAADFVDLDAPLLLAEDRDNPIRYDGSIMFPASPALWG